MNAVYKNRLYRVVDETYETVKLEDWDNPKNTFYVKMTDPDLIVDPTDGQYFNAYNAPEDKTGRYVKQKFISVRAVRAMDAGKAVQAVEDGEFDESDPLCDAVLPLTPEVERALVALLEQES